MESKESWQEVAKQLFNYCELIFFEEMISWLMWFQDREQGTAPTYEAVYNITQSYILDQVVDKGLNWEFLMIEVKRAQGTWFTDGFDKESH